MSSANMRVSDVKLLGRSFTKMTNKIGPRTVPCGMPDAGAQSEVALLTAMHCLRCDKKASNLVRRFPDIP